MSPIKDEFLSWQQHPITQWVFKALKAASLAQKAAWEAESWGQGKADTILLSELRARADAYAALEETSYEKWCETHGENPRTE